MEKRTLTKMQDAVSRPAQGVDFAEANATIRKCPAVRSVDSARDMGNAKSSLKAADIQHGAKSPADEGIASAVSLCSKARSTSADIAIGFNRR